MSDGGRYSGKNNVDVHWKILSPSGVKLHHEMLETKRLIRPASQSHCKDQAGWKAMTNLDTILKSRDIILLTKVCTVKAMVLLVVTYGCEIWTIKNTEHWRIDAFKLWCWRRLLKVLWTARKSNQLILKEISPEYFLEGLMLKFQYFGHLMWRADSLEKTLMVGKMAGGEEDVRGWDGWIVSLIQWTWVWVTPGDGEGQGSLACCRR